ncbi:MAG: hypothetical protein DHS80DRAFT_13299 [Piptocephalis tieghemiana]|nr:MAG: hypothetical protein DHS80DRAFT_13299 [Piptocephalis tieghemiana]
MVDDLTSPYPPSPRASALGPDPLLHQAGRDTSTSQAGGWFNVGSYTRYFDIDTDQVMERLTSAINPMQSDFLTLIEHRPDLYGPFWIPTTVIFLLFVTSSLAGSMAAFLSGKTWSYDVTLLSLALSTIYTYMTLLPLGVWGAAKYLGTPVSLVQLVSIYGYGQIAWVPVSLLCITPDDGIRWILVLLGLIFSGLFLVRTLRILLAPGPSAAATRILPLCVLGAQALLALLLKTQFFSYAVEWPSLDKVISSPGPSSTISSPLATPTE